MTTALAAKVDASALVSLATTVRDKANQSDLDALTVTVGEKAVAAEMTTALAAKADASALVSLATTVRDKAGQSDLDALTVTVGEKAVAAEMTTALAAKADASALVSLATTVRDKANQSDLDALTVTVGEKAVAAEMTTALAAKADASALVSLATTVRDKAGQSDLDALSATISTIDFSTAGEAAAAALLANGCEASGDSPSDCIAPDASTGCDAGDGGTEAECKAVNQFCSYTPATVTICDPPEDGLVATGCTVVGGPGACNAVPHTCTTSPATCPLTTALGLKADQADLATLAASVEQNELKLVGNYPVYDGPDIYAWVAALATGLRGDFVLWLTGDTQSFASVEGLIIYPGQSGQVISAATGTSILNLGTSLMIAAGGSLSIDTISGTILLANPLLLIAGSEQALCGGTISLNGDSIRVALPPSGTNPRVSGELPGTMTVDGHGMVVCNEERSSCAATGLSWWPDDSWDSGDVLNSEGNLFTLFKMPLDTLLFNSAEGVDRYGEICEAAGLRTVFERGQDDGEDHIPSAAELAVAHHTCRGTRHHSSGQRFNCMSMPSEWHLAHDKPDTLMELRGVSHGPNWATPSGSGLAAHNGLGITSLSRYDDHCSSQSTSCINEASGSFHAICGVEHARIQPQPAAHNSTGGVVVTGSSSETLRVQRATTFSAPTTMGESVSDTMQVWGAATFEESLTAKRAFWAQDNILLGDTGMDQLIVNAESQFRTQFTAMGYVTLGDDHQDTIVINGQIAVRHGLENKLTIDPSTGVLATAGDLLVHGSATLGDHFSDEISVRGHFTIKNNGQRVFDVNPEMGDTQIEGNLQVAGVIRTDSAFGVAEMEVATINEFELDGGVTIAGVLIRDGGILHTKIDRVDELEDGHGVTIDGVVMKNGAVITESATGTTAKGEVDMIRIINTGHDADMDETTTNIKFRQTYHDLTGAEEHEESDMVKISAVTESDWTQREDSRSAYFKVSVVNSGEMEERLRLTAEGDMLLNTDSFIVDGPTGDTLIHGNLLVTSRDGTDEREIAITSSANTAGLRIEAGDSAAGTMLIKGGATGNAEATLMGGDDMDASLTFADPSATDGASYSILVDGSSNFMQITGSITSAAAAGRRTQVSTDVLATFKPVQESTNLNGVTHTYDSLVGAVDVTGELTAENCDIRGDMVAGTLASLGNTRLGRNSSDSITIPGRFAQPYLLVDAGGDAAATCTGTADDTDAIPDCMTAFISAADSLGRHDYTAASCPPGCTYSRGGILNITFPEGAEPHTIGFPSESGEVITTSSNFSTLQAVGDVSEGNIVEGFGKAEVNSLVSVTGTELRGGVSIGNSTDNPIAVHGFITTDHLVFDADVDGDCLMLMFQDPATDYTYQGELIQLDIVVVDTERPQDLSWELVRDETQEVVASGVGQVLLQGGINGATVFLLPNGQHYTFTITDSYGDGIWKQAADDGVQVSMNGIELGSASRLTGFGGNVPINTPVTWSVEIQAGKPEDETQAFCEAQTLTPGDPLSCTGTAPEYVGVCSAICVGTANDAAATPDCRTAFNLASDTTAASCPDGCTYAPEGSHSNMAACTANSGVWISYRCTYTPNVPVTVENEEACNAEIIPVPPASLTGAGTVDPEYTGQWLIEEDCTAIDPDIADDVVRCDYVDISGEDAVADRQSCTNTGGGGVCQYIAAVAGHCSQDKTNVVRFPQEDGTLIAMHQGTTTTTYLDGNVPADVSVRATGTYLGGKVYLGTENSDQVMFPGQIDGKLQYAASSVIMGDEAMHFGATTYGVEQHYEICEPRYKDACAGVVMDGDEAANQVACEAVVRVGTQLSACTYTPSGGSVDETCTAEAATRCAAADISDYRGSVVAEACAAIDPDVPADVTTCGIVDISGNNAFEDSKSCTNAGGGGICQYTAAVDGKSELACEGSDEAARECTYLPGGGDAYTSAFKLTLGVPPLIDDLSLTLPHENGVLLSTTSEVSTLKEVGDLSFLTVDGPTLCNADLTIGDAASDKLTFVSAVHGTDAMSFDGGFAPDPTITNVAEHKPVLASTHDEDETEPDKRTARLAVDGDMGPWLVPGHGIEHMWMSANTYPYHWLAIDLQNAYDITGMEIWGANPDGTAGDLCDYSLLYRPFTMGVTNEDFSAVVSSLRTDYNDFVNDAGSLTTLWKGLASTPRWSGTAEGWQVAFDSSTIRANMDHSYGSHTFPSVKAMHVRVDISMDAGCREDNGLGSTAAAIISEVFIMGVDVRPLTTMGVVQPTQDRRIVLPDESGTVLTDTSTFSSLTTVGALSSVNVKGDSTLSGDLVIGDEITDSVEFVSRIANAELVINHPTADGDLTLEFPRPANDITISFAPLTGEVLTTVSSFSVLTDVGALSSGSIVDGFGDITVSSDIRTTDLGEITSDGKLTAVSSAQLGTVPEHEITIRGTVEVRGGATTVFSINPTDGNTFVNGNLEVGGSIEALAAPFYTNAINTGFITELIEDTGVVIEGIVFKDGGFEIAKADQIDEYTEGQGVLVDGVLMRDGGVIAEGALVSTNPRGSIDLVTLVNNGHDYEMIGTISKLKFRQYFQATPDMGSFAVDSGAIKVGTETNWNEDPESRSAYMAFDTVYRGDTYERVHISANGDFAVNVDQLTVTESNADVKMVGNVTIGDGLTVDGVATLNADVSVGAVPGMRKLEVSSTNEDAAASITSGAGKTSRLLVTGDYTETQLVSAESGDARITMMDQREKGFQWSRSEAGNILNLDRIRRGTNDVVNVAAGSTEVVSMADGDFADINIGDQILMNVDTDCDGGIVKDCIYGKLIAREVTQLLPDEGATDKIVVDSPFSAGAIVARAYYVSHRITSVTDDNTMTFGGPKASGHKRYNVQSSDSAAELMVTAANARSLGAVTVKSDNDAELRALAGRNENARLELEEVGTCTDPLDETTCTGGKGYTFWRGSGADNTLQLYRTIMSTNQIELVGGSDTLNAFGADGFDDLTIGDYIICTVNGVEEIRRVENLVGAPDGLPWGPNNYPNVVELNSAFDDETSISGLAYRIARPVMSVSDENHVFYGGTTGSKSFTISSLDAAVESRVVAKGGSSEAVMTVSSELNSALELQCGRNDDARLKLQDTDKNVGYTIARRDEGNTLSFDNTKEINGGGTVSIERSQTTVISSGALFGSIKQGDHLIVSWEGVEYSRKVTAVDVTATPHELTIDLRIADSFDIVDSQYTIGQRVLEFVNKDSVVIGGNSGAKTLVFQSTDDSATMSISAAGAANEGLLSISGEDAVEVSLKGGTDKDVRIELTDTDMTGAPSAGYRLTRTGSDNSLFLDRTYAGPGGTITVAANSATVQAANVGDFTDTVKLGDIIIVFVECDATADCGTEQRRTVTSIAVDGRTLTVDSAFSTDTALAAATFQVGRKVISVDNDDQVKIGGSGGDKTFTVESADSNTFLELISAEGISKIDVNGKVALVDINSGVGQNTKLKMRDHDIGTGYLMSRDSRAYTCGLEDDPCADVTLPTTRQTCVDAGPCVYTAADAGAGIAESCVNDCSAYLVMRTEEGAGTVRHTPGSTLVYAAVDGQFANIKPRDRLTMTVNGVETTRTVISVNMAVAPDRLTVDDDYGSDVLLEQMPYVIERPVLSVPNEDTFIMGGSTSSKSLSLQSTDMAAFFDVTAECPAGSTCNYEARTTVQSTSRSSAVVKAGLDEDAVLHLVSTAPRAHGFAMTRGGGLSNKLYLDRTAQGPGGTITCAAGETRVIGANDGDFDHIRIGDKLTVDIDGVEYSSLVVSLQVDEEPDELTVNVAFHPTESIEDHPYMRYRTVMTVDDDDTVVFGGNKGEKVVSLASTDSTATMTITSAGAQNDGKLKLLSENADSGIELTSGVSQEARLSLNSAGAGEDADFGKSHGFTLIRSADVARSDVNQNDLSLYYTSPGVGATVTIGAGSTTVTSDAASTSFNGITAGESITVECNNQRRTRKITSVNTGAQTLVVESAFCNDALNTAPYELGKKAFIVEDSGETFHIGGAFTDEDATDLRTTDLEVKGDVTMSGMMAIKSQTLAAQSAIVIESSHIILTAVTGVQSNVLSVAAPEDGGARPAGTMLFLENNDDDDAGGPTVTACPAQSRCTYVYDGSIYQVYAQVDMY